MNAELESARDDLAYMRSLVGGTERDAEDDRRGVLLGRASLWRPVLVALAADAWRGAVGRARWRLAIVIVPTVIFVGVLVMIIMKDRKAPPGGPASRALGGGVSRRGHRQSGDGVCVCVRRASVRCAGPLALSPVVVCMFQGVAWFVASSVLRRRWLGFVAAGWFVDDDRAGRA